MLFHTTKTEKQFLSELGYFLNNINGYNIQFTETYQKKLARLLKKKIKFFDEQLLEWDTECGQGNDMSVSFRKARAEVSEMLARLESKEDKNSVS